MNAVNAFAGPGGFDLGARALGIEPLGIEIDPTVCATREAAGLRTLQDDATRLDPHDFPCELFIATPPCQAWSMAGTRDGEHDRAEVFRLAAELARQETPTEHEWRHPGSPLTAEPMRWIAALRPRFVAFEQVPPVMDLWNFCADLLRMMGYACWTGRLSAERYGVPQTRLRAILMASRDGHPFPPAPTHQAYAKGEPAARQITLEGTLEPWVSMAQALGWDENELVGFPRLNDVDDGGEYRARDFRPATEPAFAVTEKARSAIHLRNNAQLRAAIRSVDEPAPTITGANDWGEREWTYERPSTTVAGDPRIPAPGHKKDGPYPDSPGRMEGSITVTVEEAAVLQGFPRDYPWRGSRTRQHAQIGDAVPPPLARAIIAALLGMEV